MAVLRTGEPVWAAHIPDELLQQAAQDEEHARIARELGLRSYLCVPLKSHTRTLGVLTYVTAESGRVYGPDDLRAAEDLAHRAAIAIENANLLAALKEADRRKDEFLATLAHELRNPLAPIRNSVQFLLGKGNPDPESNWVLEVIDRQVRHMARLLEDLLDVSRISHQKLELRKERVELAAVIQHAIETSRPLIDSNGHELTITLPDERIDLDADPVRMAQVFSNLLTNAAKYTEAGGHIRLEGQLRGSAVVVSVKDDGVGITAETLPRIFDMFSQETSVLDRSQGGLGIGLALVRGLVELHGGTIEARSDGAGKGSEFIVRLPVPEAVPLEAKPSDAAAPSSGDLMPRRLLIVDDRKDSADSLAMLMRLAGHEVHTAYDGEEAIVAAENHVPEVVLLDIGMPRRNGYEACRHIRQQPWGRDMWLIALTGWGQEDDRRRTEEAGFDHHLVKPVDPDALIALLTSLRGARTIESIES
jgi:signal transduction histidine kinase/ActR/RegA family two-component response regulator